MEPELNSRLCLHCRTPIAQADRSDSAKAGFCCGGCQAVYGVLQAKGLSQYYALRDATSDVCPVPVSSISADEFAFLDDPQVVELAGDEGHLRFFIENLQCASCLWILERLPEICPDAKNVKVRMNERTIEVEKTPAGSFSQIAKALAQIGYRPHLIRENKDAIRLQKAEDRRELLRLGAAGACTGNIMLLAVSLYAGASGDLAEAFRWLMAAFALPVMTYCAWPFYQNAWRDLKIRRISIDIPIVFAILVGIGMSVSGLIRGRETVYFDSLSMLVFLLLSSRALLKRLQRHFFQSHGLGEFLFAITVKRFKTSGGDIESVSALSLRPGDQVLIDGAQVIPADGYVKSGSGIVHSASLTGEAEPQPVQVGDWVEAGTQNMSGDWVLEAIHCGDSTRMAKILKAAERAASQKSEAAHSQVAQAFLVIVIAAMASLVLGFMFTNWQVGVERALVLAIVTCPCVFGMAIPLAESLTLQRAARDGILIKSSESLPRLAGAKKIFFDKTGTLTSGEFEIIDGPIYDQGAEHMSAALALEARGRHPVAKALRKHILKTGLYETVPVNDFAEIARGGVRGTVLGAQYEIVPEVFSSPDEHDKLHARLVLSCDGARIREFYLRDRLRSEASTVIHALAHRGLQPSIISGDQIPVVRSCARELGIDVSRGIGRLQPEDKAGLVRIVGKNAIMVGDGVNDALAMAEAGVGVAVHGSLEASLRSSDVYLMRSDLRLIVRAIDLARLNRRVIAWNLALSASYNIISGALAAAGYMTPLWAAVIMPLSSLTVLMASLWGSRREV
jgi:heavy metal translocating P-type ATPase